MALLGSLNRSACVVCLILSFIANSVVPYTDASILASQKIPVDCIYVIGMEQCEDRWNRIYKWAKRHDLHITPTYATRYNEIDMSKPPIPVSGIAKKDIVMAGQVACTTSHIRTWRDAYSKNFSKILVLEDDVRMSPKLISRFPRLLSLADQGSATRHGDPWHFIYLRMYPTLYNATRERWHEELQTAHPGWGTAAYVLSSAGIRFLLTRITAYSHPLDVQLERLQRGKDTLGAKFVALDACEDDEDGEYPLACPENIRELSMAERGNCHLSGTQAGAGFFGHQMPGSI